jgi:hypothetical protein
MKKNVSLYELNALECPGCDQPNLHQRKVSTFWRVEDAERGIRVVSQFVHTLVDEEMHGNPSLRRDGILIDFDCEHCDAEPRLSIVQHKGITLVQWESMRRTIQD